MSELLTVVTLEPNAEESQILRSIHTEKIMISKAKDRFLPALWTRLGYSTLALAFHLLGEKPNGYLTGSEFLQLPDNDENPAIIHFAKKYKSDASVILKQMVDYSEINEILLFSELTYHPIDYNADERYDSFEIEDPISLNDLWSLHDSNDLLEQIIYQVIP